MLLHNSFRRAIYDGIKSLPLDIELYQKADSLPKGNADPEFKKKPEIARDLIDQSLARGYRRLDSAD